MRTELGEGCYVTIREEAFRRVVLNLVAHARDALADGGTCSIRLSQTGDQVELSVSDDGRGMDAERQSGLFELFFTTKGGRGTGLGLHAVSEIVSESDGKIEVWSDLGGGSRFSIHWPRAKSPRTIPTSLHPPAPTDVRGRVLLVEDDPVVRKTLARSSKMAGYAPEEATDGDAGAAFIEGQAEFDVLCTDAIMPGLPTAELVKRFHRSVPGRPVLVISGYLPADMSDEFLGRPEVFCLSKPSCRAQFTGALSRALSSSAAASQNAGTRPLQREP